VFLAPSKVLEDCLKTLDVEHVRDRERPWGEIVKSL